jgi:hypothetical protein
MCRALSAASAPAITSWSAANDATFGIGVKCVRRNRPISPSTPPFSCAPSLPGMQKNDSNR